MRGSQSSCPAQPLSLESVLTLDKILGDFWRISVAPNQIFSHPMSTLLLLAVHYSALNKKLRQLFVRWRGLLMWMQVGKAASSEAIVASRSKSMGGGGCLIIFLISTQTIPMIFLISTQTIPILIFRFSLKQSQFKMMVKLHTWLKMPPPNEDMADLGEVLILL